MRKSDRTCVLASVFVSMTAIFYCGTMWFGLRLPRYYPLEHTWKWINEKDVPSQGWYGMQAFAFVAAGMVTAAMYLVLRPGRDSDKAVKPATLKTLGLLTLFIVVACLYYMLHYEFSKWGVFAAFGW